LKQKVVHLSSVYPRFDTRIFHNECVSLARNYDVSLIVADGLGGASEDGIVILDVGKPKSRATRISKTIKDVLAKATSLQADVYHLYDPEPLLIVNSLKKTGARIVYDMHEDCRTCELLA
jgi:hypothetical protein